MDSIVTPSPSLPTPSLGYWVENFEQIALRQPSKIAIISGAETLTYGELSHRSSQVAMRLRSQGIGRGSFVGLGLQRCLALPIALLGIVKSGAAYVPIDPGYPAARVEQMIVTAQLKYVVTTGKLAQNFPKVTTIQIDEDITSKSTDPFPARTYQEDDIIYAIFTSGSTGQPKAASVYHRGFDNLLHWYSVELCLGPSDRTLVISSPSFDLTQKNFFAPLVTGGTLILDDCQTYDISRITGLIQEHRVTLLNCTPSTFYPLIDASAGEDYAALSSLRFAVLGGEPISIPRIRPWLEHANCQAEVVNSYGPTECTDICTFHRLHRRNLDDYSFVPLGREIPNAQVTIRDSSLSLLPDGEIGELCISGAGLGAGYIHDPAHTAETFTHSTYRTGDLAKRLPDGILEFKGRADQQVKVNGHRIELGEIEIALNRHHHVQEAIVTAQENHLVAHILGTAEAVQLREHLTGLLPNYMMPNEFRIVTRFPQTPNGKVDRLAISNESNKSISAVIAADTLEARVLSLWSEILDRPITDATANFFDLGGSSIHLAIVHVRLIVLTGKKFPITELFAMPSARAIANFLSPTGTHSATKSAQDRARQAKASLSNFRRTATR